MKRIIIITLTIGLILTSGCTKSNNTPNISEQGRNINNFKPTAQVKTQSMKLKSWIGSYSFF